MLVIYTKLKGTQKVIFFTLDCHKRRENQSKRIISFSRNTLKSKTRITFYKNCNAIVWKCINTILLTLAWY